MSNDRPSKKIAAIYDLREAAEAKAAAQLAVEMSPTPGSRDALLDAQIELEARTAEAVDACHDCEDPAHGHGRDAVRDSGHGTPAPRERAGYENNVIDVDFGAGARSA